MKSFTAFALLALLSTASVAAKVPQVLQPAPHPALDASADLSLSDDDVRGQVRAYLGSIDTPIEAGRWKVLGARAEPLLLETIQGNELPTRRAKAIDGLALLGSTRSDVLQTIAANESEPFVVRYAALRGLGAMLPEAQMIATLSPVMKTSKDLRIRAAAGGVLAHRAPKTACGAVRAQIAREPQMNRDQYSRAMEFCFAK